MQGDTCDDEETEFHFLAVFFAVPKLATRGTLRRHLSSQVYTSVQTTSSASGGHYSDRHTKDLTVFGNFSFKVMTLKLLNDHCHCAIRLENF